MTKYKFNFLALAICILIPLVIGAIGGYLTATSVQTWYPTLTKPGFTPPNWLFGPVWTLLYILMGIASYLVWQRRRASGVYPQAMIVYGIQLILNLGWSFLFFHQHELGQALFEILLLLAFIIATGILFFKINKLAGLLFIPYLLWVSFASYLTYSIYILN